MSESHEGTPPTERVEDPGEPASEAPREEARPAPDEEAAAAEREEAPEAEDAEAEAAPGPEAAPVAEAEGAEGDQPSREETAGSEAGEPPGEAAEIEEPPEAPPEALEAAREAVTVAGEGAEPGLAEAAAPEAETPETAGGAPEPAGAAEETPASPPAAAGGEMSEEEAERIVAEAAEPPPPAEGAVETPDGAAETGAEEAAREAPLPTDPVSLRLLDALDKGTPVQGKVFGWNQGGYHVLIDGLLAFCPRSEVDLGQPRAPKRYIEKTYRFHVIEHRRQGNRFVVSRTRILEEERAKQAERAREKLTPGAVFEGRVTSLTNFGAFVDLGGGVEGMVHVSELSHRTVNHPKEVVKKGKTLKVKVLKVEEEGKRISLSVKAMEPDPWKDFAEKYPRGTPFAGKITGKTDFGVFVEVEPGIEGLVHVSALPPGASLEDEGFEPGKELGGWVKDVEVKRRRVSLSLREVPTSDPWKDVGKRYPEGEAVRGTVEEIAPFGVFINLEPGLTGLLPNSEMKLPRGTHAGRVYPPGSEVRVQVSRVEPKRKRITLVPEGATVEGSRSDYQTFKKKTQEKLGSGMPTLAAAFEKLKQDKEE